MKKFVRRILVSFLAAAIVLTVIPFTGLQLKASAMTMDSLKNSLPQGSYWNHKGTDYNTYNNNRTAYNLSSTSTPCNHSEFGNSHCSYSDYNYSGKCGCNSFDGSTQCMGFARFCCYQLFGTAPNGSGDSGNGWSTTSVDNLKCGDYIRYKRTADHYGHSVIVSGVSSDSITVLECNYDGKCGISWNRSIAKSTLKGYYSTKCLTAGGTSGGGSNTTPDNSIKLGTLTFSNYNYPTNLNVGEAFYFTGTISSPYVIEWACIQIFDKNLNVVLEYGTDPNSKSVNVASVLDSHIHMTQLKAGKYLYQIEATDKSGNFQVLFGTWFNVGAVWPNAPTLSVTAGTSAKNTTFSWGATSNTTCYDLRIYKNSVSAANLYKTAMQLKTTSYSITLPAGTYVATLASCNENYYECYTFGKTSNAFTVNNSTYTVAYNANGGTGAPASQTKTHGTNLTLCSTKPTRSVTITLNPQSGTVSPTSKAVSYTFKNWNTKSDGSGTAYDSGATYSKDAAATLYAQWTAPAAYTLPAPARTGYTFKGWNTKSDGTGTSYAAGAGYKATANVTLYAQWTANTLSVYYDANGGSISSAKAGEYYLSSNVLYKKADSTKYVQKWTYNNKLSNGLVNAGTFGLVKTGYTFTGWSTQKSGGTLFNQDNVDLVPTSFTADIKTKSTSVTMYAQWKANTNTAYKVNHYQMNVKGSGYALKETESKIGTTASSVTIANLKKTYTGFTYEGGKGATAGTTTKPSTLDTTTTILADGTRVINIYYSRNKYALTLSKGTGISSVSGAGTYYYGQSVSIDATVSTGYTWSKWSDGNTTKARTYTMPASATTLTASATLNTYTISYTLNGGTVATANSTSYNVTTASFTLKNPTKTGCKFAGWTGTGLSAATKTVTVAQGSTGNRNYTATWEVAELTVTFDADGGKCSTASKTVVCGETYGTLPTPSTRKGFVFMGWYDSLTGGTEIKATTVVTATNNQTLFARWEHDAFAEKAGSSITIENKYLFGEKLLGMTGNELSSQFSNKNIAVMMSSDRTATGDTVNLIDDTNMIYDTMTVVIFGDVNGDGWYDGQDSLIVSCLANGMLTEEQVSEAVYTAADCNHDGTIDQLDVDILNEAGVILSKIDQTKTEEELLVTSSAYIQYLNLIQQSPETEIAAEEVVEVSPAADEKEPVQINWFRMFVSFLKTLLNYVYGLFTL